MSEKKKNSKTDLPNVDESMANHAPSENPDKKSGQNAVDNWQAAASPDFLPSSSAAEPATNKGWMRNLKRDSAQFLKKQAGGQLEKVKQEEINRQAIEVTVDRMFACLQDFAYEFNRVAAGTDLHVSGTMSGDVKEVTKYNTFREAEQTESYFRARLSSRLYSLVIRGADTIIDCFVMPVNHAMALSKIENEYRPLATMEIKVSDEGVVWRSVSFGHGEFKSLEELCAWLFEQLINQTRKAIAGKSRSTG